MAEESRSRGVEESKRRNGNGLRPALGIRHSALRPFPNAGCRVPRPGRSRFPTRGFTLVEVLVAIGLLMVLMTVVMMPIVNSMGYFRAGSARADAQTVARTALDAMSRELSEAMSVQLDMEDNSAIAFTPPLRADPTDPNSDVVTPPRADWSRSIRFWRALNDPRAEYSTGTTLASPNFYFLARTIVNDPFTTNDAWNPRNAAWAQQQSQNSVDEVTDWAPIPRVVSWEKIDPYAKVRKETYQPGYPYLEAQYRYAGNQNALARYYRDRVVGMTPAGNAYDVTALSFTPLVVSGEWLQPMQGQDKSVYASVYPLWRLGASQLGWASLSGDSPLKLPDSVVQAGWARDPFLVIYHYDWTTKQYFVRAFGCFDPRSRTERVVDSVTGDQIYDTYSYPFRGASGGPAFGVDWTQGMVRFDFPPYTEDATQLDKPVLLDDTQLVLRQDGTSGGNLLGYDIPLGKPWVNWKGRTGGVALTSFVLPDTVSVRIDTDGDGQPDKALKRVYRSPRDYSDEFELGLNPDVTENDLEPRYGYLRLPTHLQSGGPDGTGNPGQVKIWVYYRWRTNGVVAPGETLAQEHPDLVSAYYRTASVIDIGITVSRTDASATANSSRLAQSVHMTRRVKLRNAIREIRNDEP